MLRSFVVIVILSCFAPASWAQSPPPTLPGSAAKSVAKKPAAGPKAAAKPPGTAESGPCRLGVIPATQDLFGVQKIGLTVFGNELTEVPVPWGLDDLAFARVRAAAGAVPVRRIAYAKGAFDSYYHPQGGLFRNQGEELSRLVRQIAGKARCERYLVVMRVEGEFPGTNQRLTGLGIVYRSAGIISYSHLFAYIRVIVLDGQTFEIKRDPGATFEGAMKRMADHLFTYDALRKVDNSMFPATAADSASSTILRDNVRGYLTELLDKILPAYFKQ